MRHRTARLLPLALLAPLLLGLSSRPENEIPEPETNFSAEIVDTARTKTRGEKLSIDGVIYFSVRRGETSLFVPFEKLRSVQILGPAEPIDGVDRLDAEFTFLDGNVEKGLLRARDLLFGSSSLGNFKIKLGDLHSVEFDRAPPP